jgi:WD40 repeat protein
LRTILRFALSIVFAAMIISAAYAQPPPTLLWSDPVNTLAIALSANGQYVVVGTPEELRFYGRSSSTPLWTHMGQAPFTSVAISADGSYVAAGGLGVVYFWANAKSLTGDPTPTWSSVPLGGPIFRRCLAISDDGNYVAACGTGPNVFYWAGAIGESGPNVATTWIFDFGPLVEAIALSDDGNYVAAVNIAGSLAYWKNAISLTGHPQPPTWSGLELGESFVDVAISDDGNYVAVAGAGAVPSTVYYWAGATSRTGTSEPHTWAGGVNVRFTSVDMSCDGDSVIAGTGFLAAEAGAGGLVTAGAADPPAGEVYFWGGARTLSGTPVQTWKYDTLNPVEDVAINDAGTYMAAVTPNLDTLYFFDKQGNLLWQDTTISGDKLSISCDGRTLAVGAPSFSPDTAHLFDTGFSTPCCGVEAVGGLVTSRNTLSVLAPYLATLGFAAAAIVAVAAFMKRREKARPA